MYLRSSSIQVSQATPFNCFTTLAWQCSAFFPLCIRRSHQISRSSEKRVYGWHSLTKQYFVVTLHTQRSGRHEHNPNPTATIPIPHNLCLTLVHPFGEYIQTYTYTSTAAASPTAARNVIAFRNNRSNIYNILHTAQ